MMISMRIDIKNTNDKLHICQAKNSDIEHLAASFYAAYTHVFHRHRADYRRSSELLNVILF